MKSKIPKSQRLITNYNNSNIIKDNIESETIDYIKNLESKIQKQAERLTYIEDYKCKLESILLIYNPNISIPISKTSFYTVIQQAKDQMSSNYDLNTLKKDLEMVLLQKKQQFNEYNSLLNKEISEKEGLYIENNCLKNEIMKFQEEVRLKDKERLIEKENFNLKVNINSFKEEIKESKKKLNDMEKAYKDVMKINQEYQSSIERLEKEVAFKKKTSDEIQNSSLFNLKNQLDEKILMIEELKGEIIKYIEKIRSYENRIQEKDGYILELSSKLKMKNKKNNKENKEENEKKEYFNINTYHEIDMNNILDNNDNEELISVQKRTISYYKKQFDEGETEKNQILEKLIRIENDFSNINYEKDFYKKEHESLVKSYSLLENKHKELVNHYEKLNEKHKICMTSNEILSNENKKQKESMIEMRKTEENQKKEGEEREKIKKEENLLLENEKNQLKNELFHINTKYDKVILDFQELSKEFNTLNYININNSEYIEGLLREINKYKDVNNMNNQEIEKILNEKLRIEKEISSLSNEVFRLSRLIDSKDIGISKSYEKIYSYIIDLSMIIGNNTESDDSSKLNSKSKSMNDINVNEEKIIHIISELKERITYKNKVFSEKSIFLNKSLNEIKELNEKLNFETGQNSSLQLKIKEFHAKIIQISEENSKFSLNNKHFQLENSGLKENNHKLKEKLSEKDITIESQTTKIYKKTEIINELTSRNSYLEGMNKILSENKKHFEKYFSSTIKQVYPGLTRTFIDYLNLKENLFKYEYEKMSITYKINQIDNNFCSFPALDDENNDDFNKKKEIYENKELEECLFKEKEGLKRIVSEYEERIYNKNTEIRNKEKEISSLLKEFTFSVEEGKGNDDDFYKRNDMSMFN